MRRMTQDKPDLQETRPTCGGCDYRDAATEECFRFPPVVLYSIEDGAWSQRPTVDTDERACGEFKPAQ